MTPRSLTLSLVCLVALLSTGCRNAPGRPGPGPEVGRPEQLVRFEPLYQQNCAACHGSNGENGAAISLANPVYLAIAGTANIERITRDGVSGTMMPPFGQHAGGMLTDQQISILAHGMLDAWGHADIPAPPYQSAVHGDSAQGQKTFSLFCARCHGADAAGIPSSKTGSLVEPAYLALVSDQSLRTTILAGRPERGMPDWRSDLVGPNARPMTDQEITDTTAWIASHRTATPGQPYPKSE